MCLKGNMFRNSWTCQFELSTMIHISVFNVLITNCVSRTRVAFIRLSLCHWKMKMARQSRELVALARLDASTTHGPGNSSGCYSSTSRGRLGMHGKVGGVNIGFQSSNYLELHRYEYLEAFSDRRLSLECLC